MSAASTKAALKAIAKMLGKFALMVFLFWAAFSYVFHFGDSQALGLGFAFAIAIDLASARKPPEQATFTRHRLIVEFHLYPMLMELGLIESDDEWKALIGEAPKAGFWQSNSVYYGGITAYVLATNPDLIHFTGLRYYAEQLELDVTLEGIKHPSTYSPWSPVVFIKPGTGGYHIGLRVNEKWWETAKGGIPTGVVLDEDKEWNFGTVRLSLAVLPYEITHTYYRTTASGHQAQIRELVAKTGWTNTELGGPEVGYFGEGYDHKYASVWAQHLDS